MCLLPTAFALATGSTYGKNFLMRGIRKWLVPGMMALMAHGTLSAVDLRLDAASDYAMRQGGTALIVARNGKILLERYARGADRDTPQRIYSGTKGLWCVAAACAADDGILDLDEEASATLPEWRGSSKEGIRVRHLLNFTAGLEPGYVLHTDKLADRNAYALQRPLVAPPGESFHYGPGSLQAFMELFRRKLVARNTTPLSYLRSRLLQPLGVPVHRVLSDRKENPLAATGFTLTPREWLKFGNFLMRDGVGGFLPIFPVADDEALEECFRGSTANPMFGLGFWLNANPGTSEVAIERNLGMRRWPRGCISSEAPADLVASVGSQGQRLYVIPSEKLVIVRMGRGNSFDDDAFFERLFGEDPEFKLTRRAD